MTSTVFGKIMEHGMWKKLMVLMFCISLCCIGVVTCLAEET